MNTLTARAARVVADSAAAIVTALGMLSENLARASAGHAPAYPEEAFDRVLSTCRLTERDLGDAYEDDHSDVPTGDSP